VPAQVPRGKLFLPMVARSNPPPPTATPVKPAPTQVPNQPAPAPPSVGNGADVFISDARINALRDRVAKKTEPTYSAWTRMLRECNEQLNRESHAPSTWFVPFYYDDKERHASAKRGLEQDANTAYREALCYRITGDAKYAKTAARLVNGWATNVKTLSTQEDSMLSFSYHFPALIFAADLIEGSSEFSSTDQQRFKTFLRDKALAMSSIARKNNQGNWGLVLTVSIAAYLDDKTLLQQSEARYKEFIATQIGSNGEMLEEIDRGDRGIYYSHFSLFPQTIAAEILRLSGIDVYNYKSSNGRTLEMAFDRIAAWSRNPGSYPHDDYYRGASASSYEWQIKTALGYFEILNERWPNGDAKAVMEDRRPITGIHTAIDMTFTHGGLLAP
jgi:hypothetical protein